MHSVCNDPTGRSSYPGGWGCMSNWAVQYKEVLELTMGSILSDIEQMPASE